MNIVKEIDGRTIEPHPERPKTVFRTFASLNKDESFVFILDHDPFHLTNIMDKLFPDLYTWEYQERGPELFKVEIGRIAAGDPKFDIDAVIQQMFAGE